MFQSNLVAALGAALLLAGNAQADGSAFTLDLNQPNYVPTEDIVISVAGQAGQFGFVLFDPDLGTTEVLPGLTIDLAVSAYFSLVGITIPSSGVMELPCGLDCTLSSTIQSLGGSISVQAVSLDPVDSALCVSNLVTVDASDSFGFCVPCAPCDGALTSLTLRYIGDSPMYVEAIKKGKEATVLYGANLQPFDIFTFVGDGKHNKLNPEVSMYLDGQLNTKIHTSCSVPIGPGQVFGDFRVLGAISQDGGATCPEDATPPATDCSAGKPAKLELIYTGGDCSESDNDQPGDKATCSGDPDDAAQVRVVAYGKKAVYVDQVVDLDASFWIDPALIGESKIASNLCVDIYALDGSLLQAVTFHTSCSLPLEVGDVFGSIEIKTFVPKS